MDTRTVIVQVVRSLFARRKKWMVLTTITALVMLMPAVYVLSKEPPRYERRCSTNDCGWPEPCTADAEGADDDGLRPSRPAS